MALKIGHASIDERGKIIGGKAGDQTGKEACIRSYYMHSKGWYMFRFIAVTHAEAMAEAMKQAANNKNIGYDQGERLDIMAALKKYGTLEKIAEPTECDCSSLIRACIYQATGIDVGNFNTESQPTVLEKSKLFKKRVSVTASTELCDGDILVTKKKGHTVAIVSGNSRILDVDGVWGKATTKRLQELFGTVIDGKVSNQIADYKAKNPGLSKATFDWKKKPNGKGSSLIRAMQKWAGMPAKEQDGEIGPNTIKAFQKKLGTQVDGYVSKPSSMVKALQRWANEQ